MSKGKFLKNIPNILTLLNISLGLCAVILLIQVDHPHKTIIAPLLIILGGFADFFDGFLARRLKSVSLMGKQLDSFADIITFGVAPILLLNYITSCEPPIFVIMASLLYIMAGAYRLARFNLADFSNHFAGLPIPVAGIALAIYSILYPFWSEHVFGNRNTIVTTAFVLVLAAMMVSKKKIKRPKLH